MDEEEDTQTPEQTCLQEKQRKEIEQAKKEAKNDLRDELADFEASASSRWGERSKRSLGLGVEGGGAGNY